jgi:hypothetical protein
LEKTATTYRLGLSRRQNHELESILGIVLFCPTQKLWQGHSGTHWTGEMQKAARRGAGAAKAQGSFSVKKKQLVA